MPATRKVGSQLLIRPDTKLRIQALSLVRTESQAETQRILIEGALPGMERPYQLQLLELRAALTKMGLDFQKGVELMIDQRVRFADLFHADGTARRTFPVPIPTEATEQ